MLAFKSVVKPESLSKQLSVFVVRNEEDAIALGEYLHEIDKRIYKGEVELKPLAHYNGVILSEFNGTLPKPTYTGADMLRFMMEQHGHKQIDLESVMARSVVSEVLNGHRELTVGQIKGLGKIYNIDPSFFLGAIGTR